jgi:hypothetical protein
MRVDSRDNKSIWDAYLLSENADICNRDLELIAHANNIECDEVDPDDPSNLEIKPGTVHWDYETDRYKDAYRRVFDRTSDPVANLKFSEKEKTHRNLPTRNPAENGFSPPRWVTGKESYDDWKAGQRGA